MKIGGTKLKVIFLDIDGVLNSNDYITYASKDNVKGILSEIDPKTIGMLKYVLGVTGAKIVASSSWRYTRKFDDLKELFLDYGINLQEKTPLISNNRGLEIKQYLRKHPDIEQYLIIDDEIFDSFDEELMNNLILTNENPDDHSYGEGLQMKHIEQIIKRFGKAKDRKFEHDEER